MCKFEFHSLSPSELATDSKFVASFECRPKEKNLWADSVCIGSSKLDGTPLDRIGNMDFYSMVLIVRSGCNAGLREALPKKWLLRSAERHRSGLDCKLLTEWDARLEIDVKVE